MELSSEKILSIPTPSATDYAFSTTSPAFLKCAFFAFRMRQVTTLYSGHIASESLTLQRSREAAKRVMMLSMISGLQVLDAAAICGVGLLAVQPVLNPSRIIQIE